MIRRFFQQDKLWLGIMLGIAIPVILYGILYLILNMFLSFGNSGTQVIKDSTLQLLAIFTNLVTLRYYLLKLKFDYTGRGILLSTIVIAIIYFVNYL